MSPHRRPGESGVQESAHGSGSKSLDSGRLPENNHVRVCLGPHFRRRDNRDPGFLDPASGRNDG